MCSGFTETGLKFLFDVKTTLNISDITFYPSQTTHGYDLYASAVNKEDILFLNLVSGNPRIWSVFPYISLNIVI